VAVCGSIKNLIRPTTTSLPVIAPSIQDLTITGT
jgi:hypothetical protein